MIGLSVVSPYLYLKENFGIYFSQSEFYNLQDITKEIIIDKQLKVKKLQEIFFYIPIGLSIIGSLFLSIGLYRWFKRQNKIDEKFDRELDKLNLEIKSLTVEEREEKVKQEVLEIELKNRLEPTEIQKNAFNRYIAIEESLTENFKDYCSETFEVLSQQKIGNKFEIDILLRAKTKKYADRIIEIKYFNGKINTSVIDSTLQKLNSYVEYYKEATNKTVVPILIIAYHLNKMGQNGLLEVEASIQSRKSKFPNLKRLKFQLIEENEIDKFDIRRVLTKSL